jgi:subtilisin family serine protease
MVWETLQSAREAEVLVLLRTQADLSAAADLPTKEAKGHYVYEALRSVAEKTQQGLRSALDEQGVDYQAFFIVNAIKMRADQALTRSLAARQDVGHIIPNPQVRGIPRDESLIGQSLLSSATDRAPDSLEPNLSRVNADQAWTLGYTGQGTVVAGNDTGIRWDHPALLAQYREQQPGYGRHDFNWHDAIDNQPVPYDDHSHGTHTLGTLVGDDGDGNQIGMAPGARWIGCKNMDSLGRGTPTSYLACFQFFLAPYAWNDPASADPDLAPDVVNNSWHCPRGEGCEARTLEAGVNALRQAGIVVVVSAGNSGSSCASVSNPPAIYPSSLTVGSLDYETDQISGFSSRGPVTYDGDTYLKPDITAPGENSAPQGGGIRSSVPGGGYGYMEGTSMAAPHVAGAVALLLSAAPGYRGKVDALEQILTGSAEPRLSDDCSDAGPPNAVWGWGVLDALAAVQLATAGSLSGSVSDASTGVPIPGAEITADLVSGLDGPVALVGPSGQYTLTMALGEYDVTARATGYLPLTVLGLPITETTTLDLTLAPLPPPEAGFESNSPICLAEPLSLTNTSTGAQLWSWDLGDGTVSADWEPTHTYTASDQYTVTLTVTNPAGADASSALVAVNRPPVAAFSWTTNDLTVGFSDDSQDASLHLWSFGDGVTSTLPAPTHTYPTSGTYDVELTVYNDCGEDGHRKRIGVGEGLIWRVYVPLYIYMSEP